MKYEDIIHKVSIELNIPYSIVDRTYKSYWKVIKKHMSSLPLKENLTDEEFKELQPNVSVPSIGKFYITLERYKNMKKQQEIIKQKTF